MQPYNGQRWQHDRLPGRGPATSAHLVGENMPPCPRPPSHPCRYSCLLFQRLRGEHFQLGLGHHFTFKLQVWDRSTSIRYERGADRLSTLQLILNYLVSIYPWHTISPITRSLIGVNKPPVNCTYPACLLPRVILAYKHSLGHSSDHHSVEAAEFGMSKKSKLRAFLR